MCNPHNSAKFKLLPLCNYSTVLCYAIAKVHMIFFQNLAHWNFEFMQIIKYIPIKMFLRKLYNILWISQVLAASIYTIKLLNTFLWQKPLLMPVKRISTFLSKKCQMVPPLIKCQRKDIDFLKAFSSLKLVLNLGLITNEFLSLGKTKECFASIIFCH